MNRPRAITALLLAIAAIPIGCWLSTRQPGSTPPAAVRPAPPAALADRLRAIPGIQIIDVRPQAGEVTLTTARGTTAGSLGNAFDHPFRLEAFTAICTYLGAELQAARDLAATRGYNALTARDPVTDRVPAGTRLHVVAKGFDWTQWLTSAGAKPGDFGALVQTNTAQVVQQASAAQPPAPGALLSLEPAWPFLDPEQLAKQPWFSAVNSTEERAASEGSYYGGAQRALSGECAAARSRGWDGIAIAWGSAPVVAGGMPETWAWDRIARAVAERDAIWELAIPAKNADPGVATAWSAVATLAQAQTRTTGVARRIRAVMPLAGLTPEDASALTVLPCFSGAEGLEWRASTAGHVPPAVFNAVLDGLALVKALEPILGPGQAIADGDVPALIASRRPLVRRVKHEAWQAVMTYDPYWAEASGDRPVTIVDPIAFPGTTLRLPAGRQVRVFVLHSDSPRTPASGATAAVRQDAGSTDDPLAVAALARLSRVVPRFQVVDLPASGTLEIPTAKTLTIADLRGVALEDDPPILGTAPPYKGSATDGLKPEERVFPARNIAPFRFHHFTNEFNISGRGVAELQDYASAHGFSLIFSELGSSHPHRPPGTRAMYLNTVVAPKNFGEDGRYDRLADQDLVKLYTSDPFSAPSYRPRAADAELHTIDLELPALRPERLRQQPWYPATAEPAARAAFESAYYRGYERMYTASVQAARAAGYPQISIYGWYLVPRTWFGLEKLGVPDPATDWDWNTYGKAIYPLVDVIIPSVYCFYVSPLNVAYTLANLDLTRAFLEALPERKPMRPYYWIKYHGGGDGDRWWAWKPIYDEEVRAMHAMAFFTGIDGLDDWDWLADPHFAGVPDPHVDPNIFVGRSFTCVPEGGGAAYRFQRYDALRVIACDTATGETRFQRILKDRGPTYGVGDGYPVYRLPYAELRSHLRPWLENAAAMFEGLALVHPVEYLLRHGRVQVDVPAQRQFAETLPIVRRITLGRYHVLITYDPNTLYAKLAARERSGTDVEPTVSCPGIELRDFAGHAGLTLHLPADDQPRIIVLRDR